MDITLKREALDRYVPVFDGEAGREFTEEVVVPDTLPDAASVADAQGVLCVREKLTSDGAVTLAGTVSVSVLYEPTDGGAYPRCVELELPVSVTMDAPGADEDCRTTARMTLCSVEARAVNSRKLSVRVEVFAQARCYRRESVLLACGLDGDTQAHTLVRTAEAVVVSDVREKAFVITDELTVPAGLSGGVRVVSRRVAVIPEDVKYVRGKAILRGRAVSELIFADGDGEHRAARYETEISQLMELDCTAEEAMPTAALMLTGAYFDMPEYGEGTGRVQAELHFTMQCVCREKRQIPYLADIYANRTVLAPAFTETELETDARPVSMRQTVVGRSEPAAEGDLFCVSASVGPTAADAVSVRTSVLIRLVSRTADGRLESSKCRLTAEFTVTGMADGARLTDVTVTAADVFSAGSDVRAVLQMDALLSTGGVLRSVSEVTEDAEAYAAQPRTPSVVLVRIPAGTELWSVAKRFGSSVDAISAANGGRCDGLILVPKAR